MLVIALLAGLVPLAVIAAPLSQVEGDIVRRNNEPKEGDKFHFNGQDHTLGHHIGKGSTASAHTIAGDHHEEHKHIIAKVFHTDKPKDRESEIENLKKVNEYHGEAKTEHGHPIILASKKEGVHITKTNAWNNAKTKDEKGKLLKHAQTLVADRNTHHANKHGLIHTDNNDGNVLFEENEHGLSKANFIDWGLAKPAEKDEDGKLKKTSLDAITGRARRFNP
jgi:hypothetical protein